ncbi:uncharacterized protein LOC120653653 [Panicum virgatum]|uniref:uncharacterized protein LOC120653653 n=1 Tax=Panicum virgatum TaxID=38727 RepID=UPI0019D55E78|nr:uncharacterized protein LOC120653653 [Panicum virgatum]
MNSMDAGANRLIMEEMCYDKVALLADSVKMAASLNSDQRFIYDSVIDVVSKYESFVYFVSGRGGRGTNLAGLIAKSSLIIWDEAPMSHKHCFEALDRSLRDILAVHDQRNASLPFGGKPMLLGGDFRQVLPVIQGGDRTEIVKASLLGSYLWRHVKVMRLSINMRLSNPSLSIEEKIQMDKFAQWVLQIGEGRIPMTAKNNRQLEDDWIQIPQNYVLSPNGPKIPAIATAIYDDFHLFYASMPYLAQRSIICPVNTIVDEINSFMLDKVPGCTREYLSFDTIANSSEQPSDFQMLYPPEFLNSIVLNNFP